MAQYELMAYSPVNYLMVDWAANGQRFNQCGLPHPRRGGPSICVNEACSPPPGLPIAQPIVTYDWDRWLPEIIVGVDDPTEEIAADYSRAAAIQFAKTTRALQREIVIPLQPGVCTYPVIPVDFENIIGIIGAGYNNECRCRCEDRCRGWLPNGLQYIFDPARNEIHLESGRSWRCCAGDTLRLLVYAAPKESACEYDSFLYEFFRADIVMAARRDYVRAVHFRDVALVNSMPSQAEIERAWGIAKLRAMQAHSFDIMQPGSGLFNGRTSFRRYR